MECLLERFTIIKKCFYCLSLKAATLFILWFWTCSSFFIVLGLLLAWAGSSADSDYALKSKLDEQTMSDLRSYVYFRIALLCTLCYIVTLQLCPHISALYGIRKGEPSYLEPCIFVKVTEIVFSIISFITFILVLLVVIANKSSLETTTGVILQVLMWSEVWICIYTVVNYFCSSVLYSYYLEMRAVKNNCNQKTPEYSAVPSARDPLPLNCSVSSMNEQLSVCEKK